MAKRRATKRTPRVNRLQVTRTSGAGRVDRHLDLVRLCHPKTRKTRNGRVDLHLDRDLVRLCRPIPRRRTRNPLARTQNRNRPLMAYFGTTTPTRSLRAASSTRMRNLCAVSRWNARSTTPRWMSFNASSKVGKMCCIRNHCGKEMAYLLCLIEQLTCKPTVSSCNW